MSAAVAAAFRESGMVVRESFGTIESFEKTPSGVRMVFSKDGTRDSAEATLAVVALAGRPTLQVCTWPRRRRANPRGYVQVDEYLLNLRAEHLRGGHNTGRQLVRGCP